MQSCALWSIGIYLDVIVIPQAVLDMIEKFKDVQSIETRLQECVHALKRSLPQVQTIVHRVLERTHLNFTNQLSLQIIKVFDLENDDSILSGIFVQCSSL